MHYELSPAQIEEIDSKLPPQFARLKDKYPLTISNVAEAWDWHPYPTGYIPQFIDIYYDDEETLQPDISIRNGQLTYVKLEDSITNPVLIYMTIEDDPAYVQIEGRVIFNRLSGVVLPEVAINPEFFLKSILKGI